VKDVYGALVTLLKADTAIAAIVGDVNTKIGARITGPPAVKVIHNATTFRPFGAGSGWLRMQRAIYFARCFGVVTDADPTGSILAYQLAGAVVDALHNKVPRTVGTAFLCRAYAPDISGVEKDPDKLWPYNDVRVEIIADQQAVA
jgi:hypothetical protein